MVRQWRTALVSAFGLLVLAVPAPPAGAYDAPGSLVSASAARDLPRREMNDEVVINSKGWLIFKGNVDPGWNNKNVQIYKRLCRSCEWTLAKKTRTDGSGHWRTRIYAPRTDYWYWKGIVPKAGGYGRSVTEIYRTYVT
jgi:hypothetical protein